MAPCIGPDDDIDEEPGNREIVLTVTKISSGDTHGENMVSPNVTIGNNHGESTASLIVAPAEVDSKNAITPDETLFQGVSPVSLQYPQPLPSLPTVISPRAGDTECTTIHDALFLRAEMLSGKYSGRLGYVVAEETNSLVNCDATSDVVGSYSNLNPASTLMHSFTYITNGSTIYSSTQIEHTRNEVFGKTTGVTDVTRGIPTLDGYVNPMNMADDVAYLDMHPPELRHCNNSPIFPSQTSEEKGSFVAIHGTVGGVLERFNRSYARNTLGESAQTLHLTSDKGDTLFKLITEIVQILQTTIHNLKGELSGSSIYFFALNEFINRAYHTGPDKHYRKFQAKIVQKVIDRCKTFPDHTENVKIRVTNEVHEKNDEVVKKELANRSLLQQSDIGHSQLMRTYECQIQGNLRRIRVGESACIHIKVGESVCIHIRVGALNCSDLRDMELDSMYTVLEQVPAHIPVPLGHKVVGTAYIWATPWYIMVNGNSVTGILQRNLLLVNDTPFKWYSKRQCVTEVITIGSEFVDRRIAICQLIGICNTLHYPTVLIRENTYVFEDDESSSALPQMLLNEWHKALSYHHSCALMAIKLLCRLQVDRKTYPIDMQSNQYVFVQLWPDVNLLWILRDGASNVADGTKHKHRDDHEALAHPERDGGECQESHRIETHVLAVTLVKVIGLMLYSTNIMRRVTTKQHPRHLEDILASIRLILEDLKWYSIGSVKYFTMLHHPHHARDIRTLFIVIRKDLSVYGHGVRLSRTTSINLGNCLLVISYVSRWSFMCNDVVSHVRRCKYIIISQ
jgi:hypothetical protein